MLAAPQGLEEVTMTGANGERAPVARRGRRLPRALGLGLAAMSGAWVAALPALPAQVSVAAPPVAEEAKPAPLYLPLVVTAAERRLRRAGTIGGASLAVAVDGRYTYLGRGKSLVVMDLADPVHGREVAAVPLGRTPTQLVLRDGLVYAVGSGFDIVDVRQPEAPRWLGSASWQGQLAPAAEGIVVLANGQAVVSVNVRNPETARYVGRWTVPAGNGRTEVVGVASSSNAVYVTTLDDLYVLDVRPNGAVLPVGMTPLSGGPMAVVGRTLVIAAEGRLHVLDLTSPLAPELAESVAGCPGGTDVLGVALPPLERQAALLCGAGEEGPRTLQLVDLADKYAPRRAGSIVVAPSVNRYRGGMSLAAAEGRVFVAGGNEVLTTIDTSDPSKPQSLGVLIAPRAVVAAATRAERAFVLDAAPAQLFTVDVSDADGPRLLGSTAVRSGAYRLAVSGPVGVVFGPTTEALDSPGFLQLVDLGDEARPRAMAQLDLPRPPLAIVGRGGYLFLADGSSILRVVNAADLAAPREVAALDAGAPLANLATAGGLLFGLDNEAGGTYLPRLQVIDITTPLQPSVAGTWRSDRELDALAMAPGRLYVGGRTEAGWSLTTLDLTDPAQPRSIGRLDHALLRYSLGRGWPLPLVAHAGSDWVTVVDASVNTFELSSPAWPQPVSSLADANGVAAHDLDGRGVLTVTLGEQAALLVWDR
jgi:hypothetical protein